VQVRQKEAAIRSLEEEREQCLDVERRLQTEMRCGRRAVVVAAAGTDDARGCDSDDDGRMLSLTEFQPHQHQQRFTSNSKLKVCFSHFLSSLPPPKVSPYRIVN